MTTVAHKDRVPQGVTFGKTVYVGRPSAYGNPFKIGPDGTRSDVIKKFRDWWLHEDQTALRKRAVIECRDKVLLCWCHPDPCHADVIAEYVNGYWQSLSALRGSNDEDPPL
jgi:hypothetical protein